jgi:hypothetical protein
MQQLLTSRNVTHPQQRPDHRRERHRRLIANALHQNSCAQRALPAGELRGDSVGDSGKRDVR